MITNIPHKIIKNENIFNILLMYPLVKFSFKINKLLFIKKNFVIT
jgi:hypothetical protein